MHPILRRAEEEFRRVQLQCFPDRAAPDLERIAAHEHYPSGDMIFTAVLADEQRFRWRGGPYLEFMTGPAVIRSPRQCFLAMRELWDRIRATRDPPTMIAPPDLDPGEAMRSGIVEYWHEWGASPAAAQARQLREQIERDMRDALYGGAIGGGTVFNNSNAGPVEPARLDAETIRQAVEMARAAQLRLFQAHAAMHAAAMQAAVRNEAFQRYTGINPFGQAEHKPEGHANSLALLREWLTEDQRNQFARRGFFEVTGCDSGRRYRIVVGRQQNVYELDHNGKLVVGLCFTPIDGPPAGDCMLAQKIALETNEAATMKVAVRFAIR